jgi:MFS family permease
MCGRIRHFPPDVALLQMHDLYRGLCGVRRCVAWLAELFPNPKRRESVLGYTQAFSSLGGFLVSVAYGLISRYGEHLPAIYSGHDAWRYTLISGLIPAIPLIVIRPFLPESPAWAEKKAAGTLKRPSLAEIFQPALLRTTVVTTLLFACSYGAAFGAIQQLPQIVAGLPGVRDLARPAQQPIVATVQTIQELGGLVGRFILAFLAIRILSRRKLLRVFQIPGLILVPLVFLFPAVSSLAWLKWGVFFAGLLTVAQFSFWGNYLPRVYPIHLRGTGESFAANIGGRMIGTSAALLTTQLAGTMPVQAPRLTSRMPRRPSPSSYMRADWRSASSFLNRPKTYFQSSSNNPTENRNNGTHGG